MGRPVLIAGAGPAGLVLACALLAAGLDCVLLERRQRADLETRARAGIITGESVAILDSHGLSGPLRAAAGRQRTCEFRTPDGAFVLAYPGAHHVYPQHLLVRDLLEVYLSRGGDARFGAAITAVEPGDEPVVVLADGQRLGGSLLADCAGRHGPSRGLFPIVERCYPYRWQSIQVEARPATPHLTYALHPDGFAGQMPRTPSQTRYYLQEPVDGDLFTALEHRLGVPVPHGPVTDRSAVTMIATIAATMSRGAVHLAGDAAHTLPPTGARGLNLAIADADDLAGSIVARHHDDGVRLRGYSARRLAAAWRAATFVDWLLTLVNTPVGPDRDYRHRINVNRLAELRDSPELAGWFGAAYAGQGTVASVRARDLGR